MTLSVIVPFFNEDNTLELSVKRLLEVSIFEKIYLVDDCSTDNSPNIAKNLASIHTSIVLSSTSTNSGKGGALSSLVGKITSSHVVIHDADLEYFPEDLVELNKISEINPNSLIIGSRFIGNQKRTNLYKRTFFANKFLSKIFSILYNVEITDIATCYKLMPSNFFNKVKLAEKGFSIEIELVAKFLKYNKSIFEVPIKYSARSYEEGKKIKPIDGIRYIVSSIKYKF
tara:strand:- start:445 stop:1128 length:684 start_codon:yes stop_codon:yes gene_type:complete